MIEVFGARQQELLKLLLKRNEGLSMDEISERLGISRPATRQHLVALEQLGYIERAELLSTGGRPVQTYRLSNKGYDLFPKQYSWFSEVLLENLKAKMGSRELRELMVQLGDDVASQVKDQVQGEGLTERVEQIAKIMNSLAYQAETNRTGKELPGDPPVIDASNCVYHSLATRFPEICQFDIALLSKLSGAEIVHEQCIIRGGGTCRFRFKTQKKK